jgi:hypothetical protein
LQMTTNFHACFPFQETRDKSEEKRKM